MDSVINYKHQNRIDDDLLKRLKKIPLYKIELLWLGAYMVEISTIHKYLYEFDFKYKFKRTKIYDEIDIEYLRIIKNKKS